MTVPPKFAFINDFAQGTIYDRSAETRIFQRNHVGAGSWRSNTQVRPYAARNYNNLSVMKE